MLKLSHFVTAAAIGILALGAPAPASAAVDLITNGNFEKTTLTASHQFSGNQVDSWTNATTSGYTGMGYNFLILPGTADTTGFTSNGNNVDKLWGPGGGTGSSNYSANGLPATSPTGGNYILADGDSAFRGGISQTLNNLTVGTNYLLSFYWAGAQFASYNGTTTEAWQVTFGSAMQNTPTVTTASHGFTPWVQQTMLFSATAVTQTLTFLAIGTPNGSPPSSLLDSVSLFAVPEPATNGLVVVGLVGLAALTWRRRGTARGTTAA